MSRIKLSASADLHFDVLEGEKSEAEQKAWDALSRYKFWMFGYWAAIWVHLNRLSPNRSPNPWRDLVSYARQREVG